MDVAGVDAKVPNSSMQSSQAALKSRSTVAEDRDAQEMECLATAKTETNMITPAATSDPPSMAILQRGSNLEVPTKKLFMPPISNEISISATDNCSNTQSSNIGEMKKAFQQMMLPEHITQGDTQMQTQPSASRTHSHADESIAAEEASPLIGKRVISSSKPCKPLLSQSVVKRLEDGKETLRKTAHELAKPAVRESKKPELILCQCGHTNEEGSMVLR